MWRLIVPINVRDDVEEHGEWVDVVGLAPRREHVLGQLLDVPILPSVRVDVELEVMPVALNGVRVRACCRVNETDPVVHGLMRVTLAAEIIVSRPTIAYDRGAWFDPSTNDGRQSCMASVLNGHEKRSTSTAFDSTEYPLTLNTMSATIFPFPELALINLDGLMRTVDLLRVVLQVHGHSLSDKLSPLSTIYIARTSSLTEPISKDTGLEKHIVLKDISNLLPTWLNTKRNITW